ncbi:glycosyltransferase [Ileibacterium valens]|uniref:glycosyltransferase n=1 Tax=Ileibacterium valens TaxID=1862668 RepID=UPI00272AFF67|nr:glycosyltransferase [Ileibacterium valens]
MNVSTVMSVYNPNEFLEKQLDSIRNQSSACDEVILVDDCSTNDAVYRINSYIEKYSLDHWKLYKSKKNRGFIETFRKGLSLASGDIIVLCDQDDIWKIDKVESIKHEFEIHPEILALGTSFEAIDEFDQTLPIVVHKGKSNNNLLRKKVEKGKLTPLAYRDIAIYNFTPGCTAAIRSSLKNDYLQWTGDLPHDWALFAIAALNDGLFYLDKKTTLYRQHGSNTYGLKHLSSLENRKKRAAEDYTQKQALASLVQTFSKRKNDQNMAKKVEKFYEKRLQMLKQKNLAAASMLLVESLQYPFLYQTIGADIKSIFDSRKST